jgi:hypothetical protein
VRPPRRPALQWSAAVVLTGSVTSLVAGVLAVLLWPPAAAPAPGAARVPGGGAPAPSSASWQTTPEDFGALGDGVADDTAALQQALDALERGQTLVLQAGRVYRHTQVLVARRPGSRITGPGQLLATDEERSSLQLQADDVQLDGVVLAVAGTTRRWEGLDQHRLVLGRHRGLRVTDVQVTGSAASGIFVDGARGFTIEDAAVSTTRADGIHMTAGAEDGVVRRPVVTGSGDDGVAVVSYQSDPGVTRRIAVLSPQVRGTTGGRGLSVVGGEEILYRDVLVEASSGAGVYLATEGAPYFTRSTRDVRVTGGQVLAANTDSQVDHGAVLVAAGGDGTQVQEVSVTGLTLRDTRPGASAQVGVLAYPGAEVVDVTLADFTVVGGGGAVLRSTASPSQVRVTGWTVDGTAVGDPRQPS